MPPGTPNKNIGGESLRDKVERLNNRNFYPVYILLLALVLSGCEPQELDIESSLVTQAGGSTEASPTPTVIRFRPTETATASPPTPTPHSIENYSRLEVNDSLVEIILEGFFSGIYDIKIITLIPEQEGGISKISYTLERDSGGAVFSESNVAFRDLIEELPEGLSREAVGSDRFVSESDSGSFIPLWGGAPITIMNVTKSSIDGEIPDIVSVRLGDLDNVFEQGYSPGNMSGFCEVGTRCREQNVAEVIEGVLDDSFTFGFNADLD